MGKLDWERLASMVICFCAGALILYFLFRYALPAILPFLLAWALSLLLRPLSERLAARLHLPRKLCAAAVPMLFVCGAVLLLYFSVGRLLSELQHLLERLLANNGALSDLMTGSADFFDLLASRLPFLQSPNGAERFSAFRDYFNRTATDLSANLLRTLSATVPAFAGRVLSALPRLLFMTLVTLISVFYFCMDGDCITAAAVRLLPLAVRQRLPAWKSRLKRFSWRYVRAYLRLLLFTFAELFVGFSVLRVEYSFLLALTVAIVDMLPVLGVGTVLIPWAVVLLLQKNYYMGFGLLILYVAVFVLRQITESRLVGHTLGLHPLLTLLAGYVGWRLFGFLGMLSAPVVVGFCKFLFGQLHTLFRSDSL